jgi:hypothetical protein
MEFRADSEVISQLHRSDQFLTPWLSLSLQQKTKQLRFTPSNGKRNTWTLGNLQTGKIRKIAAGEHMLQILCINVFGRGWAERNNQVRLWSRVGFIGNLRPRRASYVDFDYFLPSALYLDVITTTWSSRAQEVATLEVLEAAEVNVLVV